MNAEEGVREQPSELLAKIRAVGPGGLARFADNIAQKIPGQDTSEKELGQGVARANLLAYHEIIAFDRTGAIAGLAKNVPQATHQLNEIYTHALRFDVARALLTQYRDRWPNARPLRVALPIMGNANGPADDFRDRKELDVQVAAKAGATTTFVVLCGIRHAFGVQLNVLHHCCLAMHDVNVIYLRDFAQNMYLTGIGSLGGLQDTLSKLRDAIAKLNSRKVVFIGNSGGVFGALYYGARLGGDLMLLFGGPSSLELGLEETERQSYPRLQELHKTGQIEWPNIRAEYEENGKPVWFYFAGENRVDRLQAENMEGLANVDLRPVPSKHHFMVNRLAKSGEFGRVLALAAS